MTLSSFIEVFTEKLFWQLVVAGITPLLGHFIMRLCCRKRFLSDTGELLLGSIMSIVLLEVCRQLLCMDQVYRNASRALLIFCPIMTMATILALQYVYRWAKQRSP